MKSFKSHLGVIFPLIVLLFAIEFTLVVGKIVRGYEYSMGNDYNIIVVSERDLNETILREKIDTFKEALPLDATKVLDRLKDDVSPKNLAALKSSLPKFYSIKLNAFPSTAYMAKLGKILLKIDGVKKVETFSKTHDKIYKILVIFKGVSQSFAVLIALMGIALISKQMRIWLYEHRRRIEVMTDLGAPYWLKSAMLYKLAIIDSFVATAITCAFYLALPHVSERERVTFWRVYRGFDSRR